MIIDRFNYEDIKNKKYREKNRASKACQQIIKPTRYIVIREVNKNELGSAILFRYCTFLW